MHDHRTQHRGTAAEYNINNVSIMESNLTYSNFVAMEQEFCSFDHCFEHNSFKPFSKYLKIDRRLSVYKSFIQSNFSYCPVAWLFCGRKNSNKLEKLQERALRIVFNDFSSSYEFLCERANTLPLSFYRLRFLGIEMYKCIKEANPTYLNHLFCEQTSDYQLRDSSRLIQPKFNTFKFGFKSFRYFGAKLWNVLPVDIKQSESLFIFKTRITKWCYSDAAKALEEKMF